MSAYIKLSTSEYPRHVGDIALDKGNEADYALVAWADPPDIDPATQRRFEQPPVQENGSWHMVWGVRDATPEEIEAANKPFDPLNPMGI